MLLRKFMGIFAITLVIGAASLAMAGVPDVNNCLSSRAYTGTEKLIVFVVPGGDVDATFDLAVQWVDPAPYPGPGYAQTIRDATIAVTVMDGASPPQPVAIYPFEDIWLSNAGNAGESGLTPCLGGATADFSTLADGTTEFKNPVSGGGHSTGMTTVVINGNSFPNTVDVGFNSPDINGDLVVNGTDFQLFAASYGPLYQFRGDYYFDGAVNGTDFQIFAANYLASCSLD